MHGRANLYTMLAKGTVVIINFIVTVSAFFTEAVGMVVAGFNTFCNMYIYPLTIKDRLLNHVFPGGFCR